MFFFPLSALAQHTVKRSYSLLKKILHLVEAFIIVVLMGIFRIFGYKGNIIIMRFFARSMGYIFPYLKNRAINNLRLIYPDKSKAELSKIAIGSLENIMNVGVDYSFAKKLLHQKDFYEIEGIEHLQKLKAEGENAIFFSGHIASWDLFRIAAHHNNVDVAMIYRAFNNPLFDHLARYFMDFGFAPIFQKGPKGVKNMLKYLRQGGNILILLDQRISGGRNIPFLSKPAKTTSSMAEISLKYNLPLIPIFTQRIATGKVLIKIGAPIDNAATALPLSEQIDSTLHNINDKISDQIHKYPAQWFWLHNRWK